MNRLRKLVQQEETYAPESFRASLEEIMHAFREATASAVSNLRSMAGMKCGEIASDDDNPEESID